MWRVVGYLVVCVVGHLVVCVACGWLPGRLCGAPPASGWRLVVQSGYYPGHTTTPLQGFPLAARPARLAGSLANITRVWGATSNCGSIGRSWLLRIVHMVF